MPMVPTTFVPGVDQQPSQTPRQAGPFTQPMENRQPGLQQQFGAVVEQSGLGLMRQGQTIGDRIRDQLNETAVKNAETQLLGGIQATLHGPNGYLNQRGENAVSAYDGAAAALAKAKQDAEGTLTNDFQRRMFGPAADRHLITFGAEMNDHRFQQVATVSAKAATDRVDAHIPFAVNARNAWQQTAAEGKPTGDFEAHLAVVQQEAAHAANLMYGVAPDSDIAQGMMRSATTEVARGVVNGFLQDHAYKEAKTFFDDWDGKGLIDERAAEVLGNAIKENSDREFIETTGNGAALKAMAQKSAGAGNPYTAGPNPKGSVEQGNLPIWNRPVIQNADGTNSSEYSVSFQDDKGREVLVPTVVDGKFLTPDGRKPAEGGAAEKAMFQAAWDHYLKTGENLGKFDTAENADAYAEQLHNRSLSQPAAKPSFIYPVTGGSITQQYGKPEKPGQLHNGIDIAVPAGTRVMAPGSGSVLKVWDDEQNGGGRSMLVQLDNGYVAGFAHLSATNYKPGDQVTQGQPIALTGNSGWNSTGAHLHYTLTDPDGKKVDPANASQATPQQKTDGLNSFTDPRDLQTAIDSVRTTVTDPVLQKQTVNYLEGLQRKARVQQDEIQQENFKSVLDQWYKAGGDASQVMRQNPQGWAQLSEEQKYKMQKGIPKENDPETVAGFILKPDSLTVDNVKAAFGAGKLSNGSYEELLKRAVKYDSNPEKVIEASIDAGRLKYFADQAGITAYGPAAHLPAYQRDYAQLVERVKDDIDQLQQQKNGKATQSEKDAVIQREVQQHVVTKLRSSWNPLVVLGIEDRNKQVNIGRTYQLPKGVSGTAPGSDGKLHYTDAAGNDLGVVPE